MAGKVVLITGASSGIGLATAELLHEAGFTVYGTSRRAKDSSNHKFHLIELDVNQDNSVAQAVEKVISSEGKSASKHALEGYSESLDHELRSQGIRVSLIEPAYTNTSLGVNLLEADNKISFYDQTREKLHKQMINSINKSDDPSVVANTILAVIQSQHVVPRYTAGKTAKSLKALRRFVPAKIFDKLIHRSLKV